MEQFSAQLQSTAKEALSFIYQNMKYLWLSICWQRRTRQNNLWVEELQSSFMDVDESVCRWAGCFSAHIPDLNECWGEQPAGHSHISPLSPGIFQQLRSAHLRERCVCTFTPKHAGFSKDQPVKPVWLDWFCFQRKHSLTSQTVRVWDKDGFSSVIQWII